MSERTNLTFNQEDEEQKKVHYILENVSRNSKAKVVSHLICKYLESNGMTDILDLSADEIRDIFQIGNNDKFTYKKHTGKDNIKNLKESLNNICRMSFLDISEQLSIVEIDELLSLISTVSDILMFCSGKSSSPGTTFHTVPSIENLGKNETESIQKNETEIKDEILKEKEISQKHMEDEEEINNYDLSLDMELVAGLNAFN